MPQFPLSKFIKREMDWQLPFPNKECSFIMLWFIYSGKLVCWMHFGVFCVRKIIPNTSLCTELMSYLKKKKSKGVFWGLFLNVSPKSRRIHFLRMHNIVFLVQNLLVAYLLFCIGYIIYIHICKTCVQVRLLIKPLYNKSRRTH